MRGRRKEKYSRPTAKFKTERRVEMIEYNSGENHRLVCLHSRVGILADFLIMKLQSCRGWKVDGFLTDCSVL